ncbi:hypothetical protein [Gelatiniphilus marinus]|uniref:Uncharacterized protein n=1 Tax=Gelatiniphilus marinus TaxID=1759464 RepID=A0ABW5JPH8_9FLAO
MKKLFLLFLFFVGICSANNNSNYIFTDCHAEACEELAMWDDMDLSEAEAEQVYQMAYQSCEQ